MSKKESTSSRHYVCQFSGKPTTLTFLAQICPKVKLSLEIQKTNVEIRINIFETPCVPIFRQTDNFDFFSPNLPKSEIKFGNSEN